MGDDQSGVTPFIASPTDQNGVAFVIIEIPVSIDDHAVGVTRSFKYLLALLALRVQSFNLWEQSACPSYIDIKLKIENLIENIYSRGLGIFLPLDLLYMLIQKRL